MKSLYTPADVMTKNKELIVYEYQQYLIFLNSIFCN